MYQASRFRYTSKRDGEVVPLLRLWGHWLEKHGFSIEGEGLYRSRRGSLDPHQLRHAHHEDLGVAADALVLCQAPRVKGRRTPSGVRCAAALTHFRWNTRAEL